MPVSTVALEVPFQLTEPPLVECSGVDLDSRGILWLHNDRPHGREPHARIPVFALAPMDERRAQGFVSVGTAWVDAADSSASDPEDIAIGPGPDGVGEFLFLADIGDNKETRPIRKEVFVYRFRLPELDGDLPRVEVRPEDVTTYRFRYVVNGIPLSLDAEALLVDPRGNLYIASKESDRTRVFRATAAQLADEQPVIDLEPWRPDFDFGIAKVTGGDISADGRALLLRNGAKARMWIGETSFEELEHVVETAMLDKRYQGEAIAFARPGKLGFLTFSEGARRSNGKVEPGVFFEYEEANGD